MKEIRRRSSSHVPCGLGRGTKWGTRTATSSRPPRRCKEMAALGSAHWLKTSLSRRPLYSATARRIRRKRASSGDLGFGPWRGHTYPKLFSNGPRRLALSLQPRPLSCHRRNISCSAQGEPRFYLPGPPSIVGCCLIVVDRGEKLTPASRR